MLQNKRQIKDTRKKTKFLIYLNNLQTHEMTARKQIHIYRGGHGQLSGDYDLLDMTNAGCLASFDCPDKNAIARQYIRKIPG